MLLAKVGIPGQVGPAGQDAPSPAMQSEAGNSGLSAAGQGVSRALLGATEVSCEVTAAFETGYLEGLTFPGETAPVFTSPGFPVQTVDAHRGQEAHASIPEEPGFAQVLFSDIPVSAPPVKPETGQIEPHEPNLLAAPVDASEESLAPEGRREKMFDAGKLPGGAGTPEAVFLAPPPRADHVKEAFHLDRPGEIARFLMEKSWENLPKTVELRVEPAGFGRLKVLLSQRGEEVTVKFVVPSYDARRILESGAGELRHALNQHGLMLAGFGVDGREQPPPKSSGRSYSGKAWPAGERPFLGIAGGHKLDFPTLKRGVFDCLA